MFPHLTDLQRKNKARGAYGGVSEQAVLNATKPTWRFGEQLRRISLEDPTMCVSTGLLVCGVTSEHNSAKLKQFVEQQGCVGFPLAPCTETTYHLVSHVEKPSVCV